MNLHNNLLEFEILISHASEYYEIAKEIVEKDYYVTLILKVTKERIPNMIFKGGTSLSKCHKIIDRFSEDIDLTLDREYLTQSKRRFLKEEVLKICNDLKFNVNNKESLRSKRDYNMYMIDYNSLYDYGGIDNVIRMEIVSFINSFPTEVKQVSSIIYDYLKETNNDHIIELYNLEPFDMNVQTLDRTLVDKVFAICDYMISGKTERLSRHIYDIYQLLKMIKIDESLKPLINEVRELRKNHSNCYSAQYGMNINNLLQQVINIDYYKEDYNNITKKLLSKEVSYEEVIKGLEQIIESKIFV